MLAPKLQLGLILETGILRQPKVGFQNCIPKLELGKTALSFAHAVGNRPDNGLLAPKLRLPMPEISRFLGIIISMYFDEHNPPHFHIRYK